MLLMLENYNKIIVKQYSKDSSSAMKMRYLKEPWNTKKKKKGQAKGKSHCAQDIKKL